MADQKKDQDPRPVASAFEPGSLRISPHRQQFIPKKYGIPYHASMEVRGLYGSVDSLRFARTQSVGIFKDMPTDVPLLDAKAYRESLDSQMSTLRRAEDHLRKLKTTVRKKRADVQERIRIELETLLNRDPELISRISKASSIVTETLELPSPPTSPARSGSTAALSATSPHLELLEIPMTPPKSTTTGARPVPARPVKPTRLQRTARLTSASSQQPQGNNGSTAIDLDLMGSSSWTTSQGNGP